MRLRHRLPAPEVAVPLGLLYLALAALHVWEVSRHLSPTLFSDEIEFTQVSRAIADTGHPAFRDGFDSGRASLYAYLAAPAWWLGSVADSYEAIKTIGALVMTAVVFPAYGLARLVASRPLALAAAAGAGAAPALAYAAFLVEEPLAYPVATLALWLIARWLAAPSRLGAAVAFAACVAAALTRTQLAVLFPVLGIALAAAGWRTGPIVRWRATWTRGDWLGAGVLALGAAVLASAILGHHSYTWYVSTSFFKGRMLDYALWATAALGIGIGIVPLVATLAALVPIRGRVLGDRERAFAITAVAAIAVFAFYAAVKGAYLAFKFASLVPERNVIYLVPVLFAGTAWLLERRTVRLWALAAAAAGTIWLVVDTPYGLSYPNYEAHGFAPLAAANRILRWDEPRIEHALIALVLLAVAALALVSLGSRRSLRLGLVVTLIAGSVAWSAAAEVYASRGESELSERFYDSLPKPPDWLDRATGGDPAVFIGQGIADSNPIWLLEFWNRSLKKMWSLDATAPGPGNVVTADLGEPDGTLTPEPGADWVVATPGVSLRPDPSAEHVGDYTLQRLHGPIRLSSAVYGVSADGWMSNRAAYDRYDVTPSTPGLASVTISRVGWCGPDKPGNVTLKVGPLGVSPDRHPMLREVTAVRHAVLNSCEQLPVFLIRVPPGPWRAEVEVTPTFSPKQLDPSLGDTRQLGAQVTFAYQRF